MLSTILALALILSPEPPLSPAMRILSPSQNSLFGKKQGDVKDSEQKDLSNSMLVELGTLRNRIEQQGRQIENLNGMINKVSNNEGTQILSGDVSVIALGVVLFLGLTWLILYYRSKLANQKAASKILASSTSDQEALEKAKVAPQRVQDTVRDAINNKGQSGTVKA